MRQTGTQLILLQPTAEDIGVMGLNFMARGRRVQVTEQAVKSTAHELQRLREQPGTLLPGEHRAHKPGNARAAKAA